jgi:hypothetical protein
MICTGTNTEANIKKVLEFASKVISKYVISINPPETAATRKAAEDKKAAELAAKSQRN